MNFSAFYVLPRDFEKVQFIVHYFIICSTQSWTTLGLYKMDLHKAYQRALHNITTINCPVELLIEPIFNFFKLQVFLCFPAHLL